MRVAPKPIGAVRASAWFGAWAVTGVALMLGVFGILTIGLFILPVAVIALVALALRPNARASAAGLLSGLALPLLVAAYANRNGPGTVCESLAGGGSHCTDEWTPLPFLGVAAILVALSAGTFVFIRRHARRRFEGTLPPNPTNSLAVISLVAGTVAVFGCNPAAVIGLILGLQARHDIRASYGVQTGERLATGGIVLSTIGLAESAVFSVFLWIKR